MPSWLLPSLASTALALAAPLLGEPVMRRKVVGLLAAILAFNQ